MQVHEELFKNFGLSLKKHQIPRVVFNWKRFLSGLFRHLEDFSILGLATQTNTDYTHN